MGVYSMVKLIKTIVYGMSIAEGLSLDFMVTVMECTLCSTDQQSFPMRP